MKKKTFSMCTNGYFFKEILAVLCKYKFITFLNEINYSTNFENIDLKILAE